MGKRIELPGEHWAILKDPLDITERQARAVQRKFRDYGRRIRGPVAPRGDVAVATPNPAEPPPPELVDIDDEKLDAIEELEHFLVAYFIESWDFDFKATPERLNDVPRIVYNELDRATKPLVGELIPALKEDDEAEVPTTP